MNSDTLYIDGNAYQFNSKLTLSDMIIILEDISEDVTYRTLVAKVIENSIIADQNINSPSLNQILSSDDSVFSTYIETVISKNHYLSVFYDNQLDQDEPCERFYKACHEYYHTEMSELSETLIKTFMNVTSPFADLAKDLAPYFTILQQKMKALSSALSPALNYIVNFGENISKSIKEISDYKKQIDWDAWQKSFELWGSYGWAIIGNAPINFYTSPPENQIDADKKALIYFKKANIIKFWSELKTLPFSRQEMYDIDEAIYCFNAKKYKACSMLICALIDGICIKDQSCDERLNVGVKAISKINRKFKTTRYGSNKGFIFLYYRNLFRCLFALFEDTKDFKIKESNVNRNFVNHGMSKRKVLRKDCIKLFLVLHNLMELIDWYHKDK